MAWVGLPPSSPGMRIGLFGGSFNPVHAGHVLVVEETLKRLALDAVWVLVSPGNPLKDRGDLAPMAERIERTKAAMADPRVAVTGLEAALGSPYTYATLDALKARLPGRHLVWIMGADSLLTFHRWKRWREIAAAMPIAVYVRPGSGHAATASPAGLALARYRLPERLATTLAGRAPPAWVYLTGVTSSLSSSALRARTCGSA